MVYLLIQYVTIRTVANAAPTKRHAQSAMTDSVWILILGNYLLPNGVFVDPVVVLVVYAVVVEVIVAVGILPNEYLNKWCIC